MTKMMTTILIATEPTKTNTIKNLLIYEDPSEKEDNQIDLDLNIELSMTIDTYCMLTVEICFSLNSYCRFGQRRHFE